MVPPGKAAEFQALGREVERMLEEHTRTFIASLPAEMQAAAQSTRDPRRSRFLLRLVVGRLPHLFAAKGAPMPKTVIEGIDQFLKRAFSQAIYEELNGEADEMFRGIPSGDDEAMWRAIRSSPQWRRFADTVLIRILFRFENFGTGKKTFMHIVGTVMQEKSKFVLGEEHFNQIFNGLFGELWAELKSEDQQMRWDFMFGDGTSARLSRILVEGLNIKKPKTVEVRS